jgi:hypothetical protein
MKRVEIDGKDIFLPVDAKLAAPFPKDGSAEEQRLWIANDLEQPLGGTW